MTRQTNFSIELCVAAVTDMHWDRSCGRWTSEGPENTRLQGDSGTVRSVWAAKHGRRPKQTNRRLLSGSEKVLRTTYGPVVENGEWRRLCNDEGGGSKIWRRIRKYVRSRSGSQRPRTVRYEGKLWRRPRPTQGFSDDNAVRVKLYSASMFRACTQWTKD